MMQRKPRWEELGLTKEQFNEVVNKFTPKTPTDVMNWWFWGDEVRVVPPNELWVELLKPFQMYQAERKQ